MYVPLTCSDGTLDRSEFGDQWGGGAQIIVDSCDMVLSSLVRSGEDARALFALVGKCCNLDWQLDSRPIAIKVLPALLASWESHEQAVNEESYQYWELLAELLEDVAEMLREKCNPEGNTFVKEVIPAVTLITETLLSTVYRHRMSVAKRLVATCAEPLSHALRASIAVERALSGFSSRGTPPTHRTPAFEFAADKREMSEKEARNTEQSS